MMNNELKQLKRHRTCTRIALVWSCGWLVASCVLLADLVKAQGIKINHDLGPIPAELVREAAWGVRERTGIDMQVVGTSHVDCEQGYIIVRRASPAEWSGFQRADSVYSVANGCQGKGWGQVVWHPTKPVTLVGLVHELGHTAGCWTHLALFPTNAMYTDPVEPFVTSHDVACIKASSWWPSTGGNACYAQVTSDLRLYIPSIAGLAVWLEYQGGYQWKRARTRLAAHQCPGASLSGSVATLSDVRGYGLVPLSFVRLRNTGTTWTLEAAR
jgi:hypothetical protein